MDRPPAAVVDQRLAPPRHRPTRRGRAAGWATRSWPSPHDAPGTYALGGRAGTVRSPHHTGTRRGPLFPFGNDADLPPDQRERGRKSVCFEFPVGRRPDRDPRPRAGDAPAPDGRTARPGDRPALRRGPGRASTLVTRAPRIWPPVTARPRGGLARRGGRIRELRAERHRAPSLCHRIRVALSSSYWPWIWPQAGSAGFTLEAEGSLVELPVRRHTEDPGITFGRTGAGGAARRRPPGHVRRAASGSQRCR